MKRSPHASPIKTDLVVALEHLAQTDLDRAGGKGANLGELVRGGFPVPPGFVVTTTAYERFVTHNGLGRVITRALDETPGDGATIRAAFEGGPIPPEVEGQVLAAYEQLGQGAVAVRSSATAEDLPEAAFAGQQDTYLNIVSPEGLLDAVRRCWASLWTDRAIAYRERQGLDPQTVRLAAVVQRMVAAEVAGVLFTANPVTGARNEVVVEASPGLGEAVVSGQVTPDHFVLRRRWWGWRITERREGRREVIIRARAGGGTEHVDGAAMAPVPALSDRALRRLARLGTAIQRHFGGPQDVEWAWAGGQLFILQARPITALPSPPPQVNVVQRAMAGNFAELFSVRPYPLDMTAWIPALAGAIEPMIDLLAIDVKLTRLFELQDGVVVGFKDRLPRPTWKTLLTPLRLIPLIRRYDPREWRSDLLVTEAHERVRELEAREPGGLAWQELLATVHAAMQIPLLAGTLRRRYFPRAALAAVRLRLVLGLIGQTGKLATLLAGMENKTLEANRALEELAARVRSDPALTSVFSAYVSEALWPALEAQPAGRAFLVELRAFLERYGHREAVISTAREPTWKDAPEVVLGILKSFVAHPPRPHAGPPAWQTARDEVLKHRLLRLVPLRAAFLESLDEARTLLQIREDTHFCATLPLPVFRRTFLEMGRRLVEANALNAPDDIFHLTLNELASVGGPWPLPAEQAAALGAAALRRKEARARLERTPLVDPRILAQTKPVGEALLRGMPGSPGVAEGPARIVRDGFEFDKLVPGDVLVAPYTNPSWTPLFQRAAAVVVDSGSAGSHAAIVAREYGLPAVMSTVTGTQTLRDGELIRVDGSQGAVFRVAPKPAPPDLAVERSEPAR